jgi:hypothetical protein
MGAKAEDVSVKAFNPVEGGKEAFTTPLGFLNYIIRYGGKGKEEGNFINRLTVGPDDPTGKKFLQLRKYVLERADQTGEAKEFFNRQVYMSGVNKARNANKSSNIQNTLKSRTSRLVNATKCPTNYQTYPVVELFADNSNKTLIYSNELKTFQIGNQNVVASIESADIKATTSRANGGTVPLYEGSFTIAYNIDKPDPGILEAIAADLDRLGYPFQMNKKYYLKLMNRGLTGQTKPSPCNELTDTNLEIYSNTVRHEMSEWEPSLGRLKITFYFLKSYSSEDFDTSLPVGGKKNNNAKPPSKPGRTRASAPLPRTTNENLQQALLTRLMLNKSFFHCRITESRTKLKGVDTYNYHVYRSGEGGEIDQKAKVVAVDGFFLFRSLLTATQQVFTKELTPFSSEFKARLIPKEDALRNWFFIDESQVPTLETTYQVGGAGANIYGDSRIRPDDVRATWQTIVITQSEFMDFMNKLSVEQAEVTLPYLFDKYFNVLIPKVMQNSLTNEDIKYSSFQTKTPFGPKSEVKKQKIVVKNPRYWFPDSNDQERIKSYGSLGYSERDYSVSAQFTKKTTTPNAREHVEELYAAVARFSPFGRESDRKAGGQRQIGYVIHFLDNNPLTVEPKKKEKTKKRREKSDHKKTPDQLLKEGKVIITWFDAEKSTEASRVVTQKGKSPFTFSSQDNTHQSNLAAQGGGKNIPRRLHEVSFTLRDVLHVEPFLTQFVFPPSFFKLRNRNSDVFGYSGTYRVQEVSISYKKPASLGFQTSVKAIVEISDIELKKRQASADLRAAAARGKTEEEKLKNLEEVQDKKLNENGRKLEETLKQLNKLGITYDADAKQWVEKGIVNTALKYGSMIYSAIDFVGGTNITGGIATAIGANDVTSEKGKKLVEKYKQLAEEKNKLSEQKKELNEKGLSASYLPKDIRQPNKVEGKKKTVNVVERT